MKNLYSKSICLLVERGFACGLDFQDKMREIILGKIETKITNKIDFCLGKIYLNLGGIKRGVQVQAQKEVLSKLEKLWR